LKQDLKPYLDRLYIEFCRKYSSRDPVWFLHRFDDEKDIEIAGLITSCYSYGRVEQINAFIKTFLKRIDFKVCEFTSNYSQLKDKKFLKGMSYRFNSENDLSALLLNLKRLINRHGSLQSFFAKNYSDHHQNILNALAEFAIELNRVRSRDPYFRYLVPLVSGGSACKRLNLYLRWMIRKDNIDLGIWKKISTSKLIMPVDVHVYRVSRKLRLAQRKSPDLKFAIQLTEKLKSFDPIDPVKYDFALCHSDFSE